jgi:predicted transcriptional regulator
MILLSISVVVLDELTPLLPEAKLAQLIREKQAELGVSQRELDARLGIPQSLISRALKEERGFRYEEAQRIVEYLLAKRTLIPWDGRAQDLAVTEKLVWIHDDATVKEVAGVMLEKGFTQIPVKSREDGRWRGVVTDLSLLRRMLPSSDVRVKVGSLTEFNRMRIRDAGVIEGVVDCPLDSLLGVVAQMLVHFYAVLLTDDVGEVRGIITRADMLKLLCKNGS